MFNNFSKGLTLSVLSAIVFLSSAPYAMANPNKHIFVIPGACSNPEAYGPASATFIPSFPFFQQGSLLLLSKNKGLDTSIAAAVIAASEPNLGLLNTPLTQGTVTVTAKNTTTTPGAECFIEIDGHYQNGEVLLGGGKLTGTKTYTVSTVQPSSKGKLLAVSILWIADGGTAGGTAVVNNFQLNGLPTAGIDLTNFQHCGPYLQPVITVLLGP